MIPNKFARVESDDDPRRCQAVHRKGQCRYLSIPPSPYCPMHGGARDQGKALVRQYQLREWQDRVGEFADHQGIKSLREEIGILKMTLEKVVRLCETESDFILHSAKIADLVMKVKMIVESCHALEEKSGMLLDRDAALNLASQLIEIIGQYVTDPDDISEISDDITHAILTLDGSTS